MEYHLAQNSPVPYGMIMSMDSNTDYSKLGRKYNISCKWEIFREQLLKQWTLLNSRELDEVGPDRGSLAELIHKHYGMSIKTVENYLRNFERMMPLA